MNQLHLREMCIFTNMLSPNRIAEQLTFIYLNLEPWHQKRLSVAESNVYHERLLMQGNIITIVEDEMLRAYVEIWKITYEQMGRLFCGETVYALEENITDGPIAYINNAWVDPNYRAGKTVDSMMREFIKRFRDCEYVVGRREKYNKTFRAYRMKHLTKGA